jgi:hypothetical protein
MKKYLSHLFIHLSVLHDFFTALWKYKLWWSFPIIFILLILMVILLIAGNTGASAFIYPLF